MKLDLSAKSLNLESVGSLFAQHLMTPPISDSMRLFRIAMELLEEEPIEIDMIDYGLVKEAARDKSLNGSVKSEVLKQLEKAKYAK